MSEGPLRLLAVPLWGQVVAGGASVWCLWRVAGEPLPLLEQVPEWVGWCAPWVLGGGLQLSPCLGWSVLGVLTAWVLRPDRRAMWAALLCTPTLTGALFALAVIASDPGARPPPAPDDPSTRLVVAAMLVSLLGCLPSVGVLRWWRAEWGARTTDAEPPPHPLEDRRLVFAAGVAVLCHGLVFAV